MFLTTEPSISGRSYSALKVIFGMGRSDNEKRWASAIEQALEQLEQAAIQLRADGVIGVHLNTSETGVYFHVVVMGTAIKFQ